MKWRETVQGQLATEADELSSAGNHVGALALLEQALAFNTKDPVVLVYRGRELHSLERYDEAEQSLRDALAIDDNLTHAWNELGMLMESKEAFEEAAFCFEQSAKLSPNVDVLTMLANMQLAFDPQKSVENAKRALSFDPDWDEAQTILKSAKRQIRERGEE